MPVSAYDVVAASAHTSDGEDDSKSTRQGGLECTPCEDCALSGPRHRMRTMRRRRFHRPRLRLPPSRDALRMLRAVPLKARSCSPLGRVVRDIDGWLWRNGGSRVTALDMVFR